MNYLSRRPTMKQKFHYRFDNMMSAGSASLIGWLGLISIIIVCSSAVFIYLTNIEPEGVAPLSFYEAAWQSLMRTLAAGNLSKDNGWAFRFVMLIVTLGGIFVVSTLIGILNNGIRKQLEKLRKGHSIVIEKNHTLILGWSSKIFPIIRELIIANEHRRNPRIVILSEIDKEKMEDEIKARISDMKNMKVICRSGNVLDPESLHIVSPHEAKSIIILSPEAESPDIHVIKMILAITNDRERKPEPYHIVAEIKDRKNMEVAGLIGKDDVTFILSRDVISKIIVQTSRQSGLSIVYQELLDFKGSEMYFHHENLLSGKTFKDAQFAYEDSVVIGISKENGEIKINPLPETVIEKEDDLIVIAEDDQSINISHKHKYEIANQVIIDYKKKNLEVEKVLILGWNKDGITVVKEMDNYVLEGSEILVIANHPQLENNIKQVREKIQRINIEYKNGDITNREILDSIDFDRFEHIIVLCYSDIMEKQEADANTLVTLLHLRDICAKRNLKLSVVSEVLNMKNKKLAEVTKADDFIVSDHLISLLFSQISENKKVMSVFDDIFNPEGSEIYLKPADHYVQPGKEIDFYTVMESACRKNEVAIGYRLNRFSESEERAYGVVVNPQKSDKIVLGEKDMVVVFAEDE
jgi:ion channel POLLUX/CASTOR